MSLNFLKNFIFFLGKKKFLVLITLEFLQIFFLIISYYFFVLFLVNLLNEKNFDLFLTMTVISVLISFCSRFLSEYLTKVYKIEFKKNYFNLLKKKNELFKVTSIDKLVNDSFYLKHLFVTSFYFIISILGFLIVDIKFGVIILFIIIFSCIFFLKKNNLKKIFSLEKKISIKINEQKKGKNYIRLFYYNLKKDFNNIKIISTNSIFELLSVIIFFLTCLYFYYNHQAIFAKEVILIIVCLRFLITGIIRLKNNIIVIFKI